MDASPNASLIRGAVIRNCSAVGIVWRRERKQVRYIPVVAQRIPRHRAEVAIPDLADLVSLGTAFRDGAVARCQMLHSARMERVQRIGTASPALLARIAAAMAREAETRGIEERMHHMRPGD